MHFVTCLTALGMLATPAVGAVIYNNLTPNNQMAMASRPASGSVFEIESADDFLLAANTILNGATLTGILVPGTSGTPAITNVIAEIYRVFPNDSDVGRTSGPPTFSTSQVPTRVNSPSDVALDSRSSPAGELTFSTSTLGANFTALNSIQPGGIHAKPGQTTGGNGTVTGQELQLNLSFTTPFDLPAGHYFFIPQVQVSNGGTFYWLSASRPITGAGTTPFTPDLQAWTRDAALDPDWLRVGTDIVGGAQPPTFDAAFSLEGTAIPEPASALAAVAGLALIGVLRRCHSS